MDRRFSVDGIELAAHLARPTQIHPTAQPGLVIAHGFPAEAGGGINSTRSFPELADRVATEAGWAALAFSSRGVAESEGDFSLGGWQRDLAGAVSHLRESVPCDGVWIVGFGTGGALAIAAAAADPSINGVCAVGVPADFQDWAQSPRKLLVLAREMGVIRNDDYPESFDDWSAELLSVTAANAAEQLAPRNLMLIHGSDDEVVPVFDARAVADAHGEADLRVIAGAGHHLRHDPRAIAVLVGWLDRQRNALLGAD
ncbi:MAG: alpha/beta fold hydrolase [Acidimicrobiales bacterium]|nr:alpha/beta fold hydrolase [Acidimicrobiales bacterium]